MARSCMGHGLTVCMARSCMGHGLTVATSRDSVRRWLLDTNMDAVPGRAQELCESRGGRPGLPRP